MRRFSQLAMLTLLFAALVSQVQPPRFAAACSDCANESSSEGNLDDAVAAYDIAMPSVWSSRLIAGFGLLRKIDKGVIREFERAWQISGDGRYGQEGVVLFFSMEDGSYRGKALGFTGEYQKVKFKWNPAAVAIVHTHANSRDPRPSEQDQWVAMKYDVPIFTITMRGMYVYDPATRITGKVLDGLDWLNPYKWTQEVYRNLVASFFGDRSRQTLSFNDEGCVEVVRRHEYVGARTDSRTAVCRTYDETFPHMDHDYHS